MSQLDWHRYFIKMAELVASKSKDPSTKCGTVLVKNTHEIVSTGFNGLPRGLNDDLPERNERPRKYMFYEHGERNAIYNAARIGVSTLGCWAYVVQGLPCCDCARALIQAGIRVVVCNEATDPAFIARWKESIETSKEMFREAGVVVITPEGNIIT